ncbi:MAG: response regulator transcription factor [Desulfobacteraceae bacterium]|jgi:DNA-binding response OmpR family regulator
MGNEQNKAKENNFFNNNHSESIEVNMPKTILIIDDDKKLNQLLKTYLQEFGFRIRSATEPETGLHILQTTSPDLIILDVMLPGMTGFEVCKKIRQFSNIPIIMLTARGELMDKVVGLELGADDYLPKPFEPRELVARIQSILRRTNKEPTQQVLKAGGLTVYMDAHKAVLDGKNIGLTTNEFNTLALLMGQAGRVLDRDELLQNLKGMDSEAFNRTVDITISRLRQKLRDDPRNPRFIKTIWGSGYMFVGELTDSA